jgi:hypothetical protein
MRSPRAILDDIYTRILDAECGLYAIQAIARDASPSGDSKEDQKRLHALEWIADRTAEQLDTLSTHVAEQVQAAGKVRS